MSHPSVLARRAVAGLQLVALGFLVFAPTPAAGAPEEDPLAALQRELAALRADYEARIAALEAQLAALQAAVPAPAPQAPAPAPPRGDAQPASYFNPAISLIGNFLVAAGDNPVEPSPGAELNEVEIGFQAAIDPYARADIFVSLGEEGAEVEEGYVTFTALPGQLLAKVGRLKTHFGKINTLHPHNLPWPDLPLPITNLLGGEEGWRGDGVSVARLLPLGDTFSELTLQAFRGESEGLFTAESRSDLAYNAHYKLFRDLSEAANLELGLSYGNGPNGLGEGRRTELAGLDATWRWKPLASATYRGFVARAEILASRRESADGEEEAVGWFASGDWQLARRWTLGARLDSSERADAAEIRDDGAALFLTFRPSEFSLLRGELRRRDYGDAPTADELFLQLQFLIGAHSAHPF